MRTPPPAAAGLHCVLVVLGLMAAAAAQGPPPPGPLPPPLVPLQNPLTPQKAVLGKMLFWEEQLSSNNRVACGTCHRAGSGGGDPRRAVNPGLDGVTPSPDDTFGSPGLIRTDASGWYKQDAVFAFHDQVTPRMAPGNLAGAYFPNLFWDGRATGQFTDPQTLQVVITAGGALESQSMGPVLSAVEMASESRTWNQVTAKLASVKPMALATNLPADVQAALQQDPTYPALFAAAFGDPAISAQRIAFAIASYERSTVPDQTPWDQFQRNVPNALTQNQIAGMNVFFGPGRCVICHQPPLFSDRSFRNLGLRPIAQDSGREAITNDPADRGRFKVPSLRNAGLRSGFMHTGQFTDLNQVVAFYRGGGGPNLDNKDPALIPLNLGPLQVSQLIDFVQNALVDPRVAAQQAPFDRPTLYSERNPPLGSLFGAEGAGSGGLAPKMLAESPANIGNADFRIGTYNGLGGAFATLVLSLQQAQPGSQIQGVPVNVDVWVTPALVGVQLGGAGLPGQGSTTVRQGVPAAPGLIGLQLYAQWFVWDQGVPAGAASSAGAVIRLF